MLFYDKFKKRYHTTTFLIENRYGTMYKGGKFLLSTSYDVLEFCKVLSNSTVDLKIVLDYPQIFSANQINLDTLGENELKRIIDFNNTLKSYKDKIGGFHMWGKQKSDKGKWIAHKGNFDTFFGNNRELKHKYLESVFSTFNDGIARYFVPEVNSGEKDLHSIVNDLEQEGFIFI